MSDFDLDMFVDPLTLILFKFESKYKQRKLSVFDSSTTSLLLKETKPYRDNMDHNEVLAAFENAPECEYAIMIHFASGLFNK